MTIRVDLTPAEEQALALRAMAQGISMAELVHGVLTRVAMEEKGLLVGPPPRSALPKWEGQVLTGLRRTDIYDDDV
jgi:hypothetical protein